MARWLAMFALGLFACSGSDGGKSTSSSSSGNIADDDTSVAEDGADANNADTDAQLLASSLVASSATSSLELAGGGDIRALFLPRTCVDLTTATASASATTYTFAKCLGPNGLLGVSGTVTVAYTTTPDSLTMNLAFKNVTLNAATIDGTATATIVAAGAKRTMTWAAALDGKTGNAKDFAHTSNSTVGWTVGDKCFDLTGTWDGTVGTREIKTEIDDFSRCGRGCPEAGGKVVVTNVSKSKSYELDYDGTSTATYTSPNGKKTSIPLLCKD